MIHELDGLFSISNNSGWLPGCYDSRRAANYAFRFSGDELQALQDMANKNNGGTGGIITFKDLQYLKRQEKGVKPSVGKLQIPKFSWNDKDF